MYFRVCCVSIGIAMVVNTHFTFIEEEKNIVRIITCRVENVLVIMSYFCRAESPVLAENCYIIHIHSFVKL